MKLVNQIIFFAAIVGCLGLPFITWAGDNAIKNAQADIARFEQQANGLTSSRLSNVRRILKLMNLSYERLQKSAYQDEASWQEVNNRYILLKARLEGLLEQTNTHQNTVSQPGKIITAKKESAQQNVSVPALVSGQRVRVKKLVKDIASVNNGLSVTGPSVLQDPNKIAAYQKRMKQFAEALARYPQIDDPDVIAARKEYVTLRQKLSTEFKRTREQLNQLGNVQERLATIAANSHKYAVPPLLTVPFDMAEAEEWVKAAGSARAVAEHNLKQLAIIAPIAYLPNNPCTPQAGSPYDAYDIKRLQWNADNNLKTIESSYKSMADGLANRLLQIERDVLSRFQEDPDSEKRWIFIGEGREEEAFKIYDESKAIAQSSVYLEEALDRVPQQALVIIDKIEKAKKEFISRRDIALETSKLPQPKSKDEKMIAIAKGILEKPKYEFGEYGRVILTTSEIVEHERKSSELTIDDAKITLGGDLKMSGTEITWTYKWKEFKFAVPLKEVESDVWYIWWITAKNYSSGGANTPLNQWVSGEVTKSNRILKKNL